MTRIIEMKDRGMKEIVETHIGEEGCAGNGKIRSGPSRKTVEEKWRDCKVQCGGLPPNHTLSIEHGEIT
jgi:hypothetical protein